MYLVICRRKIKKLIFLLNEFAVSMSDRAVDKPKKTRVTKRKFHIQLSSPFIKIERHL